MQGSFFLSIWAKNIVGNICFCKSWIYCNFTLFRLNFLVTTMSRNSFRHKNKILLLVATNMAENRYIATNVMILKW